VPVTFDHGLQHSSPVVGAGDITTAQQRSFNITVLVEEEQGVVALTSEGAVTRHGETIDENAMADPEATFIRKTN
jgi:hypothetical protein